MMIISCARILPFLCYAVARARHGALSRRCPVTRGFFARNNVATRYLQKKQPLNGPPLTRSRRGNGFRGFPAAHPKTVFPSALFTLITTQRQREPATHETTSPLSYSAIYSTISHSQDGVLHRQQAEHAQFMCIHPLRSISEYICHREHRRRDVNQLFILTHRHAT